MDQERSESQRVEQARERVAQDVRSIAEGASVSNRIDAAKETVSSRVGAAREKLSQAQEALSHSVPENVRSLKPGENPIGMLLAGLALGFLIGLVLPVTQFERERLRPLTDDAKDRLRETGGDLVRRGTDVIKETIEAGRDAATEKIKEQARDLGMLQEEREEREF